LDEIMFDSAFEMLVPTNDLKWISPSYVLRICDYSPDAKYIMMIDASKWAIELFNCFRANSYSMRPYVRSASPRKALRRALSQWEISTLDRLQTFGFAAAYRDIEVFRKSGSVPKLETLSGITRIFPKIPLDSSNALKAPDRQRLSLDRIRLKKLWDFAFR
jgi:hypothetical protein